MSAEAARPNPYRRGRAKGREEEYRRWVLATCARVRSMCCGQPLIANEPGCYLCKSLRALFAGEHLPPTDRDWRAISRGEA